MSPKGTWIVELGLKLATEDSGIEQQQRSPPFNQIHIGVQSDISDTAAQSCNRESRRPLCLKWGFLLINGQVLTPCPNNSLDLKLSKSHPDDSTDFCIQGGIEFAARAIKAFF